MDIKALIKVSNPFLCGIVAAVNRIGTGSIELLSTLSTLSTLFNCVDQKEGVVVIDFLVRKKGVRLSRRRTSHYHSTIQHIV